jgi:hypothetical protein
VQNVNVRQKNAPKTVKTLLTAKIAIVESVRNKKLERKIEMIFIPLHERTHKFLSSFSDSESTFLFDAIK